MINKKAFFIIAASILAIAVLTFSYFKYWREPKAQYIDTDNPRLMQIRKDLNELKSELRKKGVYNCCIRNDCNWCAIYMGHCPCAELVFEKGNEKSCPECAAAWNRKQGRFPSIDPNAIKVTTFGIYGYEKGGHHHSELTEGETEGGGMHHHEGEHRHEGEHHH